MLESMSSDRKRKSDSSQQTISKFFKVTTNKKKVPVIKVLDDDGERACSVENAPQAVRCDGTSKKLSSNQGRFISKTNNDFETIVRQKINKSMDKLKKYNFDGAKTEDDVAVSTPIKGFSPYDYPPEGTHDLQSEERFSTKTPSDCSSSNFTRLNHRVNDSQNNAYTPLERQVVAVKEKNPDVLLFVECGYKYRFFGDDAEVASRELNIFCHMDHNFMTASIPVHRLNVHLSRLVEKGYKVGVVKQTETAALKAAGDNKNAPFERKLTSVYTKATFVSGTDFDVSSTGNYLACVNTHKNEDKIVTTVLLANAATGEVIYDMYEDSNEVWTGLETLFHVMKPCEVVIAVEFQNEAVTRFLQCYKNGSVDNVRIAHVTIGNSLDVDACENLLTKLADKSTYDGLLGCINIMTSYLEEFGLGDLLLSAENYNQYTSKKSWMRLDKSTMHNLELFRNTLDGQVKGSLLWILDHTNTAFGKRLLKNWLSKPLREADKIELRLTAVTELKDNIQSPSVVELKKELRCSVDLEKVLTSVSFKKVTPGKFVRLLDDLEKLRKLFVKHQRVCSDEFVKSDILVDIFSFVPRSLGSLLADFLNELDRDHLDDGRLGRLFKDVSNYPGLKTCLEKISDIEISLDEHLQSFIRPKLKDRKANYKTVSNIEYLIEVRNTQLKSIPGDWVRVTCTKQYTRYRTPFVDEKFKELCRRREELAIASNEAWDLFLERFLLKHQLFREVVQKLAVFDCLLSLATVANQPGYCKPVFPTTCDGIVIEGGRHPVIDMLLPEGKQYVANDTALSADRKIMLISGPNMGGKSSYIKQTALICILAQIGSYVPATAARLDMLDGVYTRMGGCDDIVRGKSTYMVELEEASLIMRKATEKSLVILDELGRGTSTHDGTAIAYATLRYFIEDVKPYTLFVTHYPLLSELEDLSHGYVANFHMAFIDAKEKESADETGDNDIDSIVFLYQLCRGAARKSYGLNVARLAGIPNDIILIASRKANEMEHEMQLKGQQTLQKLLRQPISAKMIKERLSFLHGNRTKRLVK